MLRTVGWMAALSLPALLLVAPAFAADKEKDKDKDKDPDKEKAESNRKLRLQVQIPTLDVGQVQAYQRAQQSYNQAQARRDWNGMRSAQQQMQQAQAKLYKMTNKDVDVQAIDDVVVRVLTPKLEYDDKGRPKKLTKEELKEAKGEGELAKMPGYKAEFSDVQTDQYVQITIVRKKGAPVQKIKAPPVKKGKGKDMDADLDALAEDNTPQVSFIMIVQQPMAK
jgi:hypothetical protein